MKNLPLKLSAINRSLGFCAFPLRSFDIEVTEEIYLLRLLLSYFLLRKKSIDKNEFNQTPFNFSDLLDKFKLKSVRFPISHKFSSTYSVKSAKGLISSKASLS